jgi:hypothetical protein
LLADAGIAAYRSRIVALCTNPFARWIRDALVHAGARVEVVADLADADTEHADAVLVAEKPRAGDIIGPAEAKLIARRWPGAVVAQFWGDVDREALGRDDVPFAPLIAPPRGHMGSLPSALGPDPVVRLQAGGLKAAEVLLRHPEPCDESHWQYVRVI